MKQPYLLVLTIGITVLFACHAQRNLYRLYKMDEFDINSAQSFIAKIQYLPVVTQISIIDTKADGNDFVVNRQHIFLDTTQQNQPNYYSVKKRANELNLDTDSLTNCLKSFYKMGVNNFCRDSGYYRFAVVVGFTTNRGYLYVEDNNRRTGDTLAATAEGNRDYHFKVVLAKQVDKHWFEYYETNSSNFDRTTLDK